ncbi:uncharacterized protein C1orf158-like [Dendronephthya gigantea]|uniref:uncharacterized protein C1orf158-like n=1 Tax=Dendronephthya gigantea TaxID=151771 RepID=UPI00106A823E|nr:uncharacterized protein C1orf158-like [Dendronephthya gigantea]
MAAETDLKWKLPGWRIESKYTNNVLIGNWDEERRKFERGRSHYNSTHRTDFKNYGHFRPDTTIRRESVIRNEGVGKRYILSHHDKNYEGNCISWYDQQFNNREQKESKLPALRKWDGKVLAYVPEKSDFPIQGAPTNYGLYQKLLKKWKEQEVVENIGEFATTYKLSYVHQQPPIVPQSKRVTPLKSSPQRWSSKLHPHQVNKDLYLRDVHRNTAPERHSLIAI